MAKKIALILAGCGVFDGAEIHEAVLSNLELNRLGFEVEYLAPDMEQAHVIDHLKGENSPHEKRNVLTEAARIARGQVKPLGEADASDYDGAVFPGGFGVAKNLCTYAFDGADMKVHEEVAQFIRDIHSAKKPLAFLCIAPMVAAGVIGEGVELTIGDSPNECENIDKMGGRHVVKKSKEWHVDKDHRVVSTPAYMTDAPITEIAEGIAGAMKAFGELVAR